jgi:hypothetical protein
VLLLKNCGYPFAGLFLLVSVKCFSVTASSLFAEYILCFVECKKPLQG